MESRSFAPPKNHRQSFTCCRVTTWRPELLSRCNLFLAEHNTNVGRMCRHNCSRVSTNQLPANFARPPPGILVSGFVLRSFNWFFSVNVRMRPDLRTPQRIAWTPVLPQTTNAGQTWLHLVQISSFVALCRVACVVMCRLSVLFAFARSQGIYGVSKSLEKKFFFDRKRK